jgi:hypothetical protein
MSTQNPVTGDYITSKLNNKAFEENFDRIFRNANADQDDECKICGKKLSSVKECAWTSCPLSE